MSKNNKNTDPHDYPYDTVVEIAYSMLTSNQKISGIYYPISLEVFSDIIKNDSIIDKNQVMEIPKNKYPPPQKNELTYLIYHIIEKAYTLGIVYSYGLISSEKYKILTTTKSKSILFRSIFDLRRT